MKEIVLTKGYSALVDDEDFDYLNQWKWQATVRGRNVYACRKVKAIQPSKKRQILIYMHRQVAGVIFEMVDHIDHNGLNNQRENLRVSDFSQSNSNKRSHSGSTSKYKGVSLIKTSGKWTAQICKDKKVRKLGNYETQEQAALAYNEAAIRLHGEFANLNKLIV